MRVRFGLVSTLIFFASAAAYADGYEAPRAPKPVMLQVSNWTGFYAGVNAGYAWGDADRSLVLDPAYPLAPGQIVALQGQASGTLRDEGFSGGGQIGYNYQTGATLFGIEADFNSLRLDKTVTSPMDPAQFGPGEQSHAILQDGVAIDRPRALRFRGGFGFDLRDRWIGL